MFLRRPSVIVLDEATSALDVKSEKELLATIEASFPACARLVITHRPSTLELPDRVINIRDGCIESLPYSTWLATHNRNANKEIGDPRCALESCLGLDRSLPNTLKTLIDTLATSLYMSRRDSCFRRTVSRETGIWAYCDPPVRSIPGEGWKIHVSGTTHTARGLIEAACSHFMSRRAYRSNSPLTVFCFPMMNGKRWNRGRQR